MVRTFVLIVLALGLIGAALIDGGIVAPRVSQRPGGRVAAGASIGVGLAIWAAILFITPVSMTHSA